MGNGPGERDSENEGRQRCPGRLHRHQRLRENRRALAHSFPPRAAEAAITENQAGGCTELAGKPLCWCIRSRSTRRQRKHCTEALTGKPIAVERSPCSILVWLEALGGAGHQRAAPSCPDSSWPRPAPIEELV